MINLKPKSTWTPPAEELDALRLTDMCVKKEPATLRLFARKIWHSADSVATSRTILARLINDGVPKRTAEEFYVAVLDLAMNLDAETEDRFLAARASATRTAGLSTFSGTPMLTMSAVKTPVLREMVSKARTRDIMLTINGADETLKNFMPKDGFHSFIGRMESDDVAQVFVSDRGGYQNEQSENLQKLVAALETLGPKSFMLRHDYKAMTGEIQNYPSDESMMPCDCAAFEFGVNALGFEDSYTVVAVLFTHKEKLRFLVTARDKLGYWIRFSTTTLGEAPDLRSSNLLRFHAFVTDQVASALKIVYALNSPAVIRDAEPEDVAPPRRERYKKRNTPSRDLPLYEVKVVDIRRPKVRHVDSSGHPTTPTGRARQRFHFREGSEYMRGEKHVKRPDHYAGDADLGVIERAYRVPMADVAEAIDRTMKRAALSDSAKGALTKVLAEITKESK